MEALFGEPVSHKSDIFRFEPDHGSGTTCIITARQLEERCELDTSGSIFQVKSKCNTRWKAFCIKCLTIPGTENGQMIEVCPGRGRGGGGGVDGVGIDRCTKRSRCP